MVNNQVYNDKLCIVLARGGPGILETWLSVCSGAPRGEGLKGLESPEKFGQNFFSLNCDFMLILSNLL